LSGRWLPNHPHVQGSTGWLSHGVALWSDSHSHDGRWCVTGRDSPYNESVFNQGSCNTCTAMAAAAAAMAAVSTALGQGPLQSGGISPSDLYFCTETEEGEVFRCEVTRVLLRPGTNPCSPLYEFPRHQPTPLHCTCSRRVLKSARCWECWFSARKAHRHHWLCSACLITQARAPSARNGPAVTATL